MAGASFFRNGALNKMRRPQGRYPGPALVQCERELRYIVRGA